MPLFSRKKYKPLGIYIHVPFCRSKCQYCDFYSVTDKEHRLLDRYRKAVCEHIREAAQQCPDYEVDTVYFGGGTPTFFGAEGMCAILTTIRKNFKVSPTAEITFEANPDSVSSHLLRRLRSEGFNRVSLGIQCDDDEILKKIGRPHTYEQAVKAYKKIRGKGFKNVSVDLMYGLPGQTLEMWKKTLTNVLQLKPEHISCYGLKVEEGTPLYEVQEFANLADDDTQADMYLDGIEILRRHGYRQYEVSNFCRKGNLSRHNLKYWHGEEYLGFGPDASSDFGGKRFSMVRDVHAYIDGIFSDGQVLAEVQDVPQRERAGEYIMMRLRTAAGVRPEEYEKQFLLPFAPMEEILEKYQSQFYAVKTRDNRWHLTPKGFLISNTILSDLLLVQEQTTPLRRR